MHLGFKGLLAKPYRLLNWNTIFSRFTAQLTDFIDV